MDLKIVILWGIRYSFFENVLDGCAFGLCKYHIKGVGGCPVQSGVEPCSYEFYNGGGSYGKFPPRMKHHWGSSWWKDLRSVKACLW